MGRIDEQFDMDCMAEFKAGDIDQLVRFLDQRMEPAGNGTAEVRNWLTAHAAVGGKGFDMIGYHPYPEWYVGCGFASWALPQAAA